MPSRTGLEKDGLESDSTGEGDAYNSVSGPHILDQILRGKAISSYAQLVIGV